MNKSNFFIISITLLLVLTLASPTVGVSARPLAITTPNLGSVNSFAVLAGSQITDAALSAITGDIGLDPGSGAAIFVTCPEMLAGSTVFDNDGNFVGGACLTTNAGLLTTAKSDLVNAYDRLAATDNTTCTTDYGVGPQDLTLVSPLGPGVYCVGAGGFALSGNLTLAGAGIWIFRSATTIITSAGSSVTGGDSCSVWWRAETAGTLGVGSTFIGNLLALDAITDNGGSTVAGRLLARNGLVALNNTTINRGPLCTPFTAGSGETEARVRGLPNTGGAPIRNDEFPWSLVIASCFGFIAFVLGVREYNRIHLSKK